MTQKQIQQKAKEAYPGMHPEDFHMREGYRQALKDIESLPKITGWIVRDKDGFLLLFRTKKRPIRNREEGYWWMDKLDSWDILPQVLQQELYPELKWKNKPKKVELILNEI